MSGQQRGGGDVMRQPPNMEINAEERLWQMV